MNDRDPAHPVRVWQMHNQRIESRTRLGLEDFENRLFAQRIGRESINGFGRKRDDFAVAQKRNRFRVIRRRDDLGLHFGTRAASTDSVCFFRNDSRAFRILLSESAMMPAARSAAFFAPAAPMARG